MDLVRLGAHDLATISASARVVVIGASLRARDDGAGDAARMTLLAEDVDDVGEIGLGGLCDHIGRGRAVAGPSACRAGRRAGRRSRARPGRAASRKRRRPSRRRRPRQRLALRRPRRDWRSGPRPASAGRPSGRPDRSRRRSRVRSRSMPMTRVPGDVEDGAAVAAGAERRVDIDAAVARREPFDRLAAQHGDMARGGRAHARPRPPRAGGKRELGRDRPMAPQILRFAGLVRLKCRGRPRPPIPAQAANPVSDGIGWAAMGFPARTGPRPPPDPVRLFTT